MPVCDWITGRLRDQPDVRQLGGAVHKNDVVRLDVAMDQSVLVQKAQGGSDGRAQADAFGHRKALEPRPVLPQGSGQVGFRNDVLPTDNIIGQFHHVVKIAGRLIASHL